MIDELRQKYTLKILLRVSGLSKSTYSYYHCEKHLNAVKRRKEEDEHILSLILPVFEHHKSRYGYIIPIKVITARRKTTFFYTRKWMKKVTGQNT